MGTGNTVGYLSPIDLLHSRSSIGSTTLSNQLNCIKWLFNVYHSLLEIKFTDVSMFSFKNLQESDIKGRKSKLSNQGRVIVIDSSEESEEGDGSLVQLQNKKVKLNTNSQSSNASPMHYTTSVSPGIQPVLLNKDSTPASTDPSMSAGQASFAAALRKLAKQAKPVPSSTSSPAPSNSSSQSVSPSISAVSGKSTGENFQLLILHVKHTFSSFFLRQQMKLGSH